MEKFTERFVSQVAPLPKAVQWAFSKNSSLVGPLCSNPALAPEVWESLIRSRRPLPEAIALVARPLDEPLRAVVFQVEARARVLDALVEANQLTASEALALDRSKLTPKISESVYHTFRQDKSVLSKLAPYFAPAAKITWIADATTEDMSDAVVIKYLTNLDEWWGKSTAFGVRSDALKRIFVARPQIVERLAKANASEGVKTAIAGSSSFRSLKAQRRMLNPIHLAPQFALLAFVANPRAHDEIIEKLRNSDYDNVRSNVKARLAKKRSVVADDYEVVSDEATFDWLVYHATPFHGAEHTKKGHLDTLLAIVHNQLLTADQASRLAVALQELYDQSLDALCQKAGRELVARFPELEQKLSWLFEEIPVREYRSIGVEQSVSAPADAWLRTTPARLGRSTDGVLSAALTEILGEAPEPWMMFLELAELHLYDSSIEDLAKTTRLVAK
jgi:hypothetical protein